MDENRAWYVSYKHTAVGKFFGVTLLYVHVYVCVLPHSVLCEFMFRTDGLFFPEPPASPKNGCVFCFAHSAFRALLFHTLFLPSSLGESANVP